MNSLIIVMIQIWLTAFADIHQIYLSEDNIISLFCPANNTAKRFVMSLEMKTGLTSLMYCFANSCDTGFPQTNASVSAMGYNFTMKIQDTDLPALRNVTFLICSYDDYLIQIKYNISIVAKPTNSTCDLPIISKENGTLSLTCSTTRVFPPAKCIPFFENSDLTLAGSMSYTHIEINGSLVYYESECTWTGPLSYFESGLYPFDVLILPNITNDATFGQTVAVILNLTLPILALSPECYNGSNIIDGYIKPGTSIYCSCYLQAVGNPPTNVTWLDENGVKVGTNENSISTNIVISPSNDLRHFYCTGFTNLKHGNSTILYTPTFAKGPDKCTVRTEKTTWDLCKVQYITLVVVCEVLISSAKPGVKNVFNINNVRVSIVEDTVLVKNSFVSQLAVNITSAGDTIVQCQAQNSKFEDSFTYCEQTIVVRVPPTLAPTLVIKGRDGTPMTSPQEHKVYNVSCLAPGGLPQVSSVTVSCGTITESTQPGNIFTSTVTFTRHMTGQNCTCTAQHITGCYEHNTAPVWNLHNVFYISRVTSFNVQSTSLVIENGTLIEMVCEAEGNPSPAISIVKGSSILYQILNGYTISLRKIMFCSDAGYYICQTNNGIYNAAFQMNQSQTLTLYVRCPLHLSNPQNTLTNYSLQIGESFSTNINIQGYPEPGTIVLFQNQNNSNDEIKLVKTLSNIFTSITNKITVSYTLKEPPNIQLQIDIRNLTNSDCTKYALVVTQTGFQNFTHSFYISCAQANSPLNEQETNVGAIVGGCISAVIIILLIVTLVFIKRKYYIVVCKKKQIERDKQIHNYSDLLASSEQQDGHNYETPQIRTEMTPSQLTQNTKSRYNNVLVPDTPNSLLTTKVTSSYCNTAVNPDTIQDRRFVVKYAETADHRYEEIDLV